MDALRSVCYDVEFEVNKNPLEKADRTVDDLTKSLVKMGESSQKSVKLASGSFKEIDNQNRKFGKGIDDNTKKIENMWKMMQGAYTGVVGSAVVAGIERIANKAYDLADGFANIEYTAAKINTLAKQDLPTILDDMRRLSLDFGIEDANLVGEAMYQALSSGQNYPNLIDSFIEENLKISKSGFVDPLGAVDLTTTIMNTYQMEEVNGIGDALLATQDRGKTTVNEINQYYSKQFGAFRSIGVGYKDALALLAETTRMGQRTADAATGIGAIISEFSKSDSTVNEYFKELNGETIPEFLKKGGDIIETISMIKSTLEVINMSSFDMFGSVEAARTFETMTSDMNGLLNTQESLIDSVGTLNESYKTMSETTKTELEKASAAWNDFKITLGEKVAPIVVDTLNTVIDVIEGESIGMATAKQVHKRIKAKNETYGLDPRYYAGGGINPEFASKAKYEETIENVASVGKRTRAKKDMERVVGYLAQKSTPEEMDEYLKKVSAQQVDYTTQYNHATGDEKGRLAAVLDMNSHMMKLLEGYKQNFNIVSEAVQRLNPGIEKDLGQMINEISNTTTNESTQTTTVNNYITVTTQQERDVATRVANEIERSTIAYIPKSFSRSALMGVGVR